MSKSIIGRIIVIIFLSYPVLLMSQESGSQSDLQEESFKHSHLVLTIGHSLIPSAVETDDNDKMLVIPIWGLGYEYSFTERFTMGLKGEIEASNYIITNEEGTELEREFPVSLSLLVGYKVYEDLGLFAGPGMEFEKSENLFIVMLGVLYEIEIPGDWELTPEFSYELKGGHTGAYSIGLTVGKNF